VTLLRDSETAQGPTWHRRRIPVGLALAGAAAAALVGYGVAESGNGVETDTVECLSAENTISCELTNEDWTIGVPLDVAWRDSSGSFHEDGRPECLPPTGIGLEGPVTVHYRDVRVDGMGWKQVVQVDC